MVDMRNPTAPTYNGWTNYETWAVKLWIDNEEPSHRHWQEVARRCLHAAKADRTFTRKERAALDLRQEIKDATEEAAPEVQGVYADLLNAALGEVNWLEIATSLIEDNA